MLQQADGPQPPPSLVAPPTRGDETFSSKRVPAVARGARFDPAPLGPLPPPGEAVRSAPPPEPTIHSLGDAAAVAELAAATAEFELIELGGSSGEVEDAKTGQSGPKQRR